MNTPYFHAWQDFWHMAGQGVFVWSAYGIAFVIIALNIAMPLFKRKKLLKKSA